MIYLDNASTTQVRKEYIEAITEQLEKFGNPSNHYDIGLENKKVIEESRNKIAEILKCGYDEIIFTSGASEGNAWALKQRKNVLCSAFEHHNILNNENAIIVGEDYLYSAVQRKLETGSLFIGNYSNFLYSHMYVNNITGEIFDIFTLGDLVHKLNPDMCFHVDGTQALGKVKIDFAALREYVDIMTFSGHKLHTPKGIGFIWFNKKFFNGENHLRTIKPLIYGGGQEFGLRAGTENVPYIKALGMAVEYECEHYFYNDIKYNTLLKTKLIECLNESGIDFIPVTPKDSIASTYAFCIKNVESELIQSMLNDHGIYVGIGSACNGQMKELEDDSVLLAMKIPDEYIHGLIRISFSSENTENDIRLFVKELTNCCEELDLIK